VVPAAGVIETSERRRRWRAQRTYSPRLWRSFDKEAAARGRELATVIEETGLACRPNAWAMLRQDRLVTLTGRR